MVRILTAEWPKDQWITHRSVALGDEPFLLIENDPTQTEYLNDEDRILALSLTVGGGWTEGMLPHLLRRMADLLEIQQRPEYPVKLKKLVQEN